MQSRSLKSLMCYLGLKT
uniref:Uncharacterized protein n=1 Tax=Arundo donax TaxID=35708 RepID=A0A0A9BPZ6_ARUDO